VVSDSDAVYPQLLTSGYNFLQWRIAVYGVF
jgi:hypothetical protein